MATGLLSIKLRCASWQQLATIYKRDLCRGAMFLKATTPPPLGTTVRIDLTLPSASVITLTGVVSEHLTDPQRGAGVLLTLEPLPTETVWMLESALASESKRAATPAAGTQVTTSSVSGPHPAVGGSEDLVAAEQELIKALLAEAESMRRLNPFLVLGVDYAAADADIRAAFGELTKRYHPDLFTRYESTELRQVASEIFILIRDAYRKLGTAPARAQALAALGRQAATRVVAPPVPAPPAVPKPLPTSVIPPLVKIPAPSGPAAAASPDAAAGELPTVRRAPPPDPGDDPVGAARTVLMSGATPAVAIGAPADRLRAEAAVLPQTDRKPMVASPPPVLTEVSDGNPFDRLLDDGKFDEALAAFKVLAKKYPTDRSFRAGIELAEGLKALAQRDRLEAAQRFEAALEIDPSNERAARELAEMRRQATNDRKGLLTRLMGKKEG